MRPPRVIVHSFVPPLLALLYALAFAPGLVLAQDGSVLSLEGPVAQLQADTEDAMLLRNRFLACGDITAAGTPIAGNAAGGGTSGQITIAGIPATASVVSAQLYWTVLTDSDQASETGKTISFDGNLVSGDMVGFDAETPCFSQTNTVAWTADVTGLVADPGNGVYAVSGFPGSNNIAAGDFTEGISLVIAYADSGASPVAVVSYEGLTVTNVAGETLNQTLTGFVVGGAGAATWVPVVGNGQVAFGAPLDELLEFVGGAGSLNFDGTLDGSTVAFAAETCSFLDSPGNTSCYWDDDVHDTSAAFNLGDVLADVNYELGTDCHSFVAMDLAVSVDDEGICAIGGRMADIACPPNAEWQNHGEYVSCVSHAKEAALADLTCLSEERLEEISSCIVNPRARSDVGKPSR